MGISVSKGFPVSLTQLAGVAGLESLTVGLGWTATTAAGVDVSSGIDASALILDADRKLIDEQDFVFYSNLQNPSESLWHTGDGAIPLGDGDREKLTINLFDVPPNADAILVILSIYDPVATKITFDTVHNLSLRVLRNVDSTEILHFEIPAQDGAASCLVVGEIYRKSGEWKFRALSDSYDGGLADTLKHFGLTIV
jgi:tellurium resistance protein TerD